MSETCQQCDEAAPRTGRAPATMDEARAVEINSAMSALFFASMDLGPPPPEWLAEVSLGDMVLAAKVVRSINRDAKPDASGKRMYLTVPDDRVIAAMYTLMHYQPGDNVIRDGRGKSVVIRQFREKGCV